jgi:hypothetical protein
VSIHHGGQTVNRWIEIRQATSVGINLDEPSSGISWRHAMDGAVAFAWDDPIYEPTLFSVSDLSGNSIWETQISEGETELLWDARTTGHAPIAGTFVARLVRSSGNDVCAFTLSP